jgi:hypothetical protein
MVQNGFILIDDHEYQVPFLKTLAVDSSLAANHLLKDTADRRIIQVFAVDANHAPLRWPVWVESAVFSFALEQNIRLPPDQPRQSET